MFNLYITVIYLSFFDEIYTWYPYHVQFGTMLVQSTMNSTTIPTQ